MEVQLSLVLALSVHLCHLFERFKHGLHDPVIRRIHRRPYLQRIGTDELALNKTDVDRKVFDKVDDALPFLAGQFRLLDAFNLLVLTNVSKFKGTSTDSSQYGGRKDLSGACAACSRH